MENGTLHLNFSTKYQTVINGEATALRYIGEGYPAKLDWLAEEPGETVVQASSCMLFFKDASGNEYAGVQYDQRIVIVTGEDEQAIVEAA